MCFAFRNTLSELIHTKWAPTSYFLLLHDDMAAMHLNGIRGRPATNQCRRYVAMWPLHHGNREIQRDGEQQSDL